MSDETPLDKLLNQLQEGLANDLLKRVQSGTATASDLNVARQFLKDNGIDSIPTDGSAVGNLAEAVPFNGDDQDLSQHH